MLDFTHGLELGIRDRLKGKHHQPVISSGPNRIILDWADDTITVIVKMQEASIVLETTQRKVLLMADPGSTKTILDQIEDTRSHRS